MRTKKDKFEDLDQEWKDGICSMSPEEIKSRVADIALELETLLKAREDDADLQAKQLAAKEANAVYSEGKKGARLRIKYAKSILEAKGKD